MARILSVAGDQTGNFTEKSTESSAKSPAPQTPDITTLHLDETNKNQMH